MTAPDTLEVPRDVGDLDVREATAGALVRRATLGDRAAFAELFRRHSAATFRYATHMLDGDEHGAQDVVQEAWTKAWVHLPGFRGDASFTTWVFRIVVREVHSSRRRRRPIPVTDEQMREHLDQRAHVGGADTEATSLLANALALELLRLPWRQRAVWILRELEELTYAEIAAVLEVSETVVRGQLHRARRTLAIRMEGWR